MSKRATIKENLSEENIDTPVRRSSRISLNPTSINSAIPKTIASRRGSANGISEKNKSQNADTSPVESAGRRKTRRTSTEDNIKSTPIKTQKSSISKIVEEDKKVSSSPKTPSRRVGIRAASTSPNSAAGVPARRTRRSTSASQENEVVLEQIPLRRSNRRRSSVDTLEDSSNEEVLTKSKPTPRRRRSNSVDENEETTKNDVKSKTKRLYSEDNQLEPIEEHEIEVTEKSERKTDKTDLKTKKSHDLSVIEESEDTDQKDSTKIIKDIDDELINNISSPKSKTVTEKIKTKSIFSPLTTKPILSKQHTDIDSEIASSDIDTENEFQQSQKEKKKFFSKTDSLKNTSPFKKPSKEESDMETENTLKTSAKSNEINSSKKNDIVTNGSNDSFTLNISKTLDKIQSSNDETDEDVFTSPGSNKENSCINVPSKKNENRVSLKEDKSSELSDLDVEVNAFTSKTSSPNNSDEPMEVDCEFENVKDCSKTDTPNCFDKESKMLSFHKTQQKTSRGQSQEDPKINVQKVKSSGDTKNKTETTDILGNITAEVDASTDSLLKSSEKIVINGNEMKSNTQLKDSGDDKRCGKINVSCSSTISNSEVENSFTSLKQNNTSPCSPGKWAIGFTNRKERKDGNASSDISINLVDSDEEDQDGKERELVVEQNSETTISTDSSMKESETEKVIQEATIKEHTELFLEEVKIPGSPKKKRTSHQPIMEENSSSSDEKSKDENAIQNSPSLLSKQVANYSKSEPKLNEFEKRNSKGKSPRHSFNNKSRDDSEEDILVVKGVVCEENSLKIKSSPSNIQDKKQRTEQSNIEKSFTEMELNKSLKGNAMKEIKVSKNNITELGNTDNCSVSDTHCKKKSKSFSLNSESEEMNSVNVEEEEEELIDSEQKSHSIHFLNESFADDEAESKKSSEKLELNDSVKNKKDEKQTKETWEIDSSEIDENIETEKRENSEDGNQKEEIIDVTEDNNKVEVEKLENTSLQLKPKSKQGDEKNKEPNSDVNSKKDKITLIKGNKNSKVSSKITSDRSGDLSTSESDVETDSSWHKSNRASKIENENLKSAASPLKSKIEKMKACGVNFVNPSPTASRIRLNEKTSEKLDQYLNEKFSALQNEEQGSKSDENVSEDENESMSDHYSSVFLDNMAEEGEEDTPSEGSNDIVDEGESINSKDSEVDPDDTYDSDDSFLVKDNADDLSLLPGEEYDLEDASELIEKPSKKRRRIVKNLNSSSEEEESAPSPRVSFSDKVEVIPEEKSPVKQISPKIITKDNKNENILHRDSQDGQHQVSQKNEPDLEIPSIFVDLIDDSSEDERTGSEQKKAPAFDKAIRTLIEDEKSSTPNTSFNETANTSKQNSSLRSSSIIIHENVNINEIKEGLLTEKLHQVVSVFCAGIRSSDGNISMNVSLDYVENAPKEFDNKKVNDVDQTLNSPECEKTRTKSIHSPNKSEGNNDSINRGENSRKRKFSNASPKIIEKEQSINNDFIEELTAKNNSLLDASFNDETSILDVSKSADSKSAKKKRRSSTRKEKQLNNKNIVISDISYENYKEDAKKGEVNKFEDSSLSEEKQSSSFKKRRRSSSKIEKSLNENLENTTVKEGTTEKKVEDNSEHEESNPKNYKSQSTDEDQESKHSDYELRLNIEKDVTDEESKPVKKKRKKENKKFAEKTSSEVLPEMVTTKRQNLVKTQCEELSANDLRHKLPSLKESSEELNVILKTKKLKRLQSNLRRDFKSTLLSGLVTDVKNRPRRMIKPSIEMDTKDWLIEETLSKPSSANLSKSTFNFKKIDAKDFKNQMLYDPRIKREPTSTYLRKKGYY